MTDTKKDSLTEGPLTIRIIKFIVPLMLTGFLQLLYNAVDSIVVGHFDGKNALAAVSSVGSLVNLLTNVSMGLAVGAAVTISHDYGAKDDNGVERTVHTSYIVAVVAGLIVGLIGFFFSRDFLVWMDSPEDVLPLSTTYLKIFFLGMPANLIYNFGASILRSIGDTKRPLIFLTIAGLSNVVMNVIFVAGFRMGVAGVAWSTVISQIISAVMVVVYQMHCTDCIKLDLRKLRVHADKLKKIIFIGLPAGVQGSLFAVSNVVIQSSVNAFGSMVMAANGASASLEGFVWTAMNSVHQASQTFVGQNMGAKKYDRLNRVTFTCLAIVVVVGIVFGYGFILFGEPLLRFYLPDNPEAIPLGMLRLKYIESLHFFCGCMDVMVGAQRGLGMSVTPMITSLVGSCALRIVWINTIFAARPTLVMLYISYPISWALTFAVHLVFYFFKLRSVKKKAREEGWVPESAN